MNYEKTWEVMHDLEESFNRISVIEDMIEDLVYAVDNDEREQVIDITHALNAYMPVYVSQYDKASKRAWNNTVIIASQNNTSRWREMSGDGKYKDDINPEPETL